MTSPPSNWVKRHSFWVYVALACAITWAGWIPVEIIAAKRGYILPNPATLGELSRSGFQDSQHVILSIILVFISGPTVAAVITAAIEGGKAGLRDLWRRCTKWRVGVSWYLRLLLLVLCLSIPVLLIGLLLGPLPTAGKVLATLSWVIPWFFYALVSAGPEEPGWRGYALPKLQARHSAKKSSLVIGAIWGLWHWPGFIPVYLSAASDPSTSPIAAVFIAAQGLVAYTGGSILGLSFVYTWLYNRTKSAFMCILFHTVLNVASAYMQAVLPHPAIGMVAGIVRWVVAIVLLRFFWIEPSESE